jgi:hypothetical protein
VPFYIESELVVIAETVDGIPPKEVEANARLIAAAPDLLDALYAALPFVETAELDAGHKASSVAKITAHIRATIAKAEGRAE